MYPNDDGGVSVYFRDVTERKEREAAQQRAEKQYKTLLELAPLPIVAVESDTKEVMEINESAEKLLGYTGEKLTGQSIERLYPDNEIEAHNDIFNTAKKHGGTYRNLPDGTPYRLTTKDNEEIPIEINVRNISLDGQNITYALLRDVTEERQYRRRLSTLNEVTNELFATDSERSVLQNAADTVDDILDVATVGFYQFDEDEWRLRSVISAGKTATEGYDMEPRDMEPGEGAEWTALKNRQTITIDDTQKIVTEDSGPPHIRSKIAVPVGEQFVLVAGATQPAAFDYWTVSLIETLGATAEAAINQAQQQQEITQQNNELRNLQSLNNQIRNISLAIVEADSRAGLEELVCDRLTNAEQIDFAWIGRTDYQEAQLSPQTQAGIADGYLETVSLRLDGGDEVEPTVQAARSRTACKCANTTKQLLSNTWRSEAVERDFASVLSIPLVNEESLYGVVSVYSTSKDGFPSMLQSVLEELCDLLANAIVSKERKEALHTDQAVELQFDVHDESCLFEQVVAGTGCKITLDRFIQQTGGATLIFLRVTDGAANQVARQAERVDRVKTSTVVGMYSDPLVQLTVDGSFICTTLANSAYRLSDVQVTAEETCITIEVPTTADTRRAVTLMTSQFSDAQLIAKEQVDTLSDTDYILPKQVLDTLTPRQREVVETAYRAGYFESPRKVNGAEVAEMFGFSDTAFHQHIRDAQSRLFEQLLSVDEESLSSVEASDPS
jgi:PAS domain S-box-containing protein